MLSHLDHDEGQASLRPRTTLDESPEAIRQVRLAIARAKEGDRDAIRLLYIRYSGNVYGYLRSIVRDEKEAEDLTQHVFMKLMTAIAKYEDQGVPFSGWLLRLARNVALDHLRKRRATPTEEVFSRRHSRRRRAGLRAQPAHRPAGAARGAAQRRGHAPPRRPHATGDRQAPRSLRELDPRAAPSRPARAAGRAPPTRRRTLDVHVRGMTPRGMTPITASQTLDILETA